MKYIIIIAVVIICGGAGYYYYSHNRQTTNMSSQTSSQADQQQMTDLVKKIYTTFQNKDINALKILSKVRNENTAKKLGQPVDVFRTNMIKDFTSTMNDQKSPLLTIDYSTLKFTPEADGTTIYVTAERTQKPLSYKDPITFYQEDIDFAQGYELYISKIDGIWQWVK